MLTFCIVSLDGWTSQQLMVFHLKRGGGIGPQGNWIYIYIYIYISATAPQAQLRVQSLPQAQVTSPPVFQFSSRSVVQSSNFPDPVPVGVGVWRPILENPVLGGCRGTLASGRMDSYSPGGAPGA